MQKTKIEWCDYTINPVKGKCPMACPYCYARRMYDRFKWDSYVRYDDTVFPHYPSGAKVFVGSTMELFGAWIKKDWLKNIFADCRANPQANFIFLTKRPENLKMWSPFPANCWVGVSITNNHSTSSYVGDLANIQATVKFVSIEPLLSWVSNLKQQQIMPEYLNKYGINWLIVGQQTPPSVKTTPKVDWIAEIVEAADEAKIPVFLKNNLAPLLAGIQ